MAAGKDTTETPANRRDFLTKLSRWAVALISTALLYPLLRFLGFTIKPKPRYIKVAAPLPASGYHTEREFILFVDQGAARAVSRTCTHLGCRVNFLEDKQIIECPCHQSRFTAKGKLLSGPAKKNLTTFPVEIQTDETGTTTGYLVTI
jgi:cytochrome b6-f complex iron-sulfur subunit